MHPGRPPRCESVPDSPYNDGSRDAIFVGGPRDGERKKVASEDATIFTFDAPAPYWGNSCSPAKILSPQISTYERVAVTPEGVAIFEVARKPCTTTLEIEVVHNSQSDPKLVRGLVAEYVTKLADDYRAFPAGIKSARLKD